MSDGSPVLDRSGTKYSFHLGSGSSCDFEKDPDPAMLEGRITHYQCWTEATSDIVDLLGRIVT